MEALKGIVLVAQMPSKPPELIVVYPPSAVCTLDAATSNTSSVVLDRRQDEIVFGIPSLLFARFTMPDEISNRPMTFDYGSGLREVEKHHQDHLLLVSFPCQVSDFAQQKLRDVAELKPNDRVQRFNVVYVLDSRFAVKDEAMNLWEVVAHLARGIVSEEVRAGYLSREIGRLHAEARCGVSACEDNVPDGLPQLLKDAYSGMRQQGYVNLRINGLITCNACMFPKHKTPTPPKSYQALVLTAHKTLIIQELPSDSASIVRRVLEAATPTRTLDHLVDRLALPLATLQRVAQHLVYWRKVRVIDVFSDDTRVAMNPDVDTGPSSEAAKRFLKRPTEKKSQNQPDLKLTEVINKFEYGTTLAKVRRDFEMNPSAFDEIFEWLVAEELLYQAGTFYDFVPLRADQPLSTDDADKSTRERSVSDTSQASRKSEGKYRVSNALCEEYGAKLQMNELKVLARSALDEKEHRFLCRFVVEFVKPRRRVDGVCYRRLAASLGTDRAKELLNANSDVLRPYVCLC
eukprot:TRINITY_DN64932_c0_g1_i1.p1 TRINITY_DN64932_c0_g1~~TRINITY_DN64932_c0_g1_i1.p1  ORF type:complete len:517 (+),score=62.16 TRINITY_DN64932_c0_g1_i1:148-1698(+)